MKVTEPPPVRASSAQRGTVDVAGVGRVVEPLVVVAVARVVAGGMVVLQRRERHTRGRFVGVVVLDVEELMPCASRSAGANGVVIFWLAIGSWAKRSSEGIQICVVMLVTVNRRSSWSRRR